LITNLEIVEIIVFKKYTIYIIVIESRKSNYIKEK